jgi:hypothetical protein
MLVGPPKDLKQLNRLYGLFSYASKSIKDAANLLTPFRELLKRGAKFSWTSDHDVALDKLKQALSTEAMGFYNKDWITGLRTDASPTGLDAVLSQVDPSDNTNQK